MNAKKAIEISTNLAILLACGVLVWSVVSQKLASRAEHTVRPAPSLIGNQVPTLQNYEWSQHSATLVLAIRTGCRFCESSLPFYRRLAGLESNHTLNAHLLAVMPDSPSVGLQMLKAGGIAVDTVYNQPLLSLKVSGTPTLLLVDSSGRITHAWIGELPSKDENDVVTSVRN